MTRWIAAMLAAVGLSGTSAAYGQESVPGPGAVVVTIIPGGGTFFTEEEDIAGPSFNNYQLGVSAELHFNRYVGIEGEVSGALGLEQDLQFSGETFSLKTPNLLNYGSNLVLSAANRSSVVPYVTGGFGGLSLFKKADLGINETETFLTNNVGGGVKWFSGRWGLRGDYRLIRVQSKEDPDDTRVRAPSFFGQETRYGHRVYGGVVINAWR